MELAQLARPDSLAGRDIGYATRISGTRRADTSRKWVAAVEGSEIRSRRLHESHGLRTYVVVFDEGDPVYQGLTTFARRKAIDAASLSAVGAFSEAILAYFDPEQMDYIDIEIDCQVEVLSMLGDVAVAHEGPEVHAHVASKPGRGTGTRILEALAECELEMTKAEGLKPHPKRSGHETHRCSVSSGS